MAPVQLKHAQADAAAAPTKGQEERRMLEVDEFQWTLWQADATPDWTAADYFFEVYANMVRYQAPPVWTGD